MTGATGFGVCGGYALSDFSLPNYTASTSNHLAYKERKTGMGGLWLAFAAFCILESVF